jgi:hypothetical protein
VVLSGKRAGERRVPEASPPADVTGKGAEN